MAWIGYSNENTNPNTWENWIQADYYSDVGANDEYYTNLSGLNAGTYYYASRFQLSGGDFYYGGYPDGFWDGITNISGVLTVTSTAVINWCNLADPPSHIMTEDDSVEIFSQLFVDGVTNLPGAGEGISAWIGYSNENNDPATWNNWVLADYNQDVGGNDEYSQFLSGFNTGTYYYASRFQIDESNYYYGGYPSGFWDGMTNISGVLTVTPINYVDEISFKLYRYSLYQNHPNPYNPKTMIRYELPELSFVIIKVYDVLGNEIATLVNEEKPAGSYEVEFHASTLPSGIYFYLLRAGSFVEMKKMILLK
jgi:hypothetical protein